MALGEVSLLLVFSQDASSWHVLMQTGSSQGSLWCATIDSFLASRLLWLAILHPIQSFRDPGRQKSHCLPVTTCVMGVFC